MTKPDIILICCEGTSSEPGYFRVIIRMRRLGHYPRIEIVPGQKQHEKMIELCADERNGVSCEEDIDESKIETWAVCDRDDYRGSYIKLEKYAESKNVKLAFSDPQFETFLIQHFELNKTAAKGKEIEQKLESEIVKHKVGDNYNKGSFEWLEELLYNKPLSLELAIQNSNKLNSQTKPPFLTVQNLVQRLIELGG